MRVSSHSIVFTLLVAAIAALPSFGVDMSLPALGAIAASLGVSVDKAGLTISLFMLGYAVAPPLFGAISDQIGRRPIILGAIVLFSAGSLSAAAAPTLATLLLSRFTEGMGAGVAATLAFVTINDLYAGAAGRAKISHLATVMLLVPMLAPAAGTAALAVGDWRDEYALLAAMGLILAAAAWLALGESRDIRNARTFNATALLRGYAVALRHPVCLGYMLMNAGGFGALFAYISGSPLLLIDALGLSRVQYSMAYAVTFMGIMASVLLNARLSLRGVSPAYPLLAGLALSFGAAIVFLLVVLCGVTWPPGLVAILFIGAAGFGLIAPNAVHGALQPLPQHAGAVSAMATFVQVLTQSASSAAVVAFDNMAPGLSMAVTMTVCSAVAMLAYATVARSVTTHTASHSAP